MGGTSRSPRIKSTSPNNVSFNISFPEKQQLAQKNMYDGSCSTKNFLNNTLEETPLSYRGSQISVLTAEDCELIPIPEKALPKPHVT